MNHMALLKRLMPMLPAGVNRFLRTRASERRQHEKAARQARTRIAASGVLDRLADCTIDGDFMIHGSISNIGKFDLPIPEFVSRWLDQVDCQRQTVLCPALPYNTSMREFLNDGREFDVRTASNAMGAISNIIMANESSLRSLHPTHSVLAIGASAPDYVARHERDETPFGINSPYRKLTERKGKIVLLGVGLNAVTNFHVIEDLLAEHMPVPVYLPGRYRISCTGPDGSVTEVITACHDPRVSARRDCERARRALIDAGAIVTHPLGESELSVLDAHSFAVTLLRMLGRGESIYGPVSLNPRQRQAILECLERLA
jgi:aminoglycoside 3-N-acetyltransferase